MRIPCEVTVLDARMARTFTDTRLTVHFDDGRWLEGPAYSVAGRYLLFSDIPNDRTLRLDEMSGQVAVFDAPSRFANGRTFDPLGRAVTCLHGARSVVRVEHDGSETLIAGEYEGRRLNSPNDVVVDSHGDIWFTDPTYGIASDYEGHAAESEQPVRGLYRWQDADATLHLVSGEFEQPNGLAFSPDESVLYVVDSGRGSISAMSPAGEEPARVLVAGDHRFDGIRVDLEGRIWAATATGVSCFDPEGVELLRIAVPERVSNLTFGGRQGNVLYLTATTTLYSVRTSVTGRAMPGAGARSL
jgi:gluconolactonase